MKYIRIIFTLLIISLTANAQVKVGNGGNLEPTGPFPAMLSNNIAGGLHVLQDTALLPAYLRDSAAVFQKKDGTLYRWDGGKFVNILYKYNAEDFTLDNISNNAVRRVLGVNKIEVDETLSQIIAVDQVIFKTLESISEGIIGQDGVDSIIVYFPNNQAGAMIGCLKCKVGGEILDEGGNEYLVENATPDFYSVFGNVPFSDYADSVVIYNRKEGLKFNTNFTKSNGKSFTDGQVLISDGTQMIAKDIYTQTQVDSLKPPEMILSTNNNNSFHLTNYKVNDTAFRNSGFGYRANGNSTRSNLSGFGYFANQQATGSDISGFGYYANYIAKGDNLSSFGYRANQQTTGNNLSGFGYRANQQATGSDISGFGYFANYLAEGSGISGFGYFANQQATGNNLSGFGYHANRNSTADNLVSIGYKAGENDTTDNQLKIEMRNLSATPLIHGDFLLNELYLPTVQIKQNFIDANGLSLTNGQALISDGTQMNATSVETYVRDSLVDYIKVTTGTLNFANSIAAGSDTVVTYNVEGVQSGDAIHVTPTESYGSLSSNYLPYEAFYGGINQVAVRFYNPFSTARTPGDLGFYILITKAK